MDFLYDQASYFKSVSTALQSQHVQAITTVKEFMNGGDSMSLKMVTPNKEGGMCHISFINSATQKVTSVCLLILSHAADLICCCCW